MSHGLAATCSQRWTLGTERLRAPSCCCRAGLPAATPRPTPGRAPQRPEAEAAALGHPLGKPVGPPDRSSLATPTHRAYAPPGSPRLYTHTSYINHHCCYNATSPRGTFQIANRQHKGRERALDRMASASRGGGAPQANAAVRMVKEEEEGRRDLAQALQHLLQCRCPPTVVCAWCTYGRRPQDICRPQRAACWSSLPAFRRHFACRQPDVRLFSSTVRAAPARARASATAARQRIATIRRLAATACRPPAACRSHRARVRVGACHRSPSPTGRSALPTCRSHAGRAPHANPHRAPVSTPAAHPPRATPRPVGLVSAARPRATDQMCRLCRTPVPPPAANPPVAIRFRTAPRRTCPPAAPSARCTSPAATTARPTTAAGRRNWRSEPRRASAPGSVLRGPSAKAWICRTCRIKGGASDAEAHARAHTHTLCKHAVLVWNCIRYPDARDLLIISCRSNITSTARWHLRTFCLPAARVMRPQQWQMPGFANTLTQSLKQSEAATGDGWRAATGQLERGAGMRRNAHRCMRAVCQRCADARMKVAGRAGALI